MASDIVFKPKAGKVVVFVDDREADTLAVSHLAEKGAEIVVKRLAVADFVISERVGIEKKTSTDFESSIMDGRLFAQARELVENFERPLLVLVGNKFESLEASAIRGALIALMVDYRLPVHGVKDEEAFAEFVYHAAFREQLQPEKELHLRLEKRAFPLEMYQQFVVEGLPLVGPVTAKSLLKHFGTVERVFTAGEEELMEAEGVGKVRAAEIRKVVSAKYKHESRKGKEAKEGA